MRTLWSKRLVLAGMGTLLAIPLGGCMNAVVQRVLVGLAV